MNTGTTTSNQAYKLGIAQISRLLELACAVGMRRVVGATPKRIA
jgi:hypothetical protein